MQHTCYFFISSDKKRFDEYTNRMLHYLATMNTDLYFLFYPEGWSLDAENKERDERYAIKNDLKVYHQVLHPRKNGFRKIIQCSEKYNLFDKIYDITVAYPEKIPHKEFDIFFKGIFPKKVDFNVKTYDINDIPKDEKEQSDWLDDVFQWKEHALTKYYNGEKSFLGEERNLKNKSLRFKFLLLSFMLIWMLKIGLWIYLSVSYVYFRWYQLGCVIFAVLLGFVGGADLFITKRGLLFQNNN